MKKKLIFAMSTAILAAGLSFGVSYEAEGSVDYPCKNGGTFAKKTLGICYGETGPCYRCRIFAQ